MSPDLRPKSPSALHGVLGAGSSVDLIGEVVAKRHELLCNTYRTRHILPGEIRLVANDLVDYEQSALAKNVANVAEFV